MKRLIAIAALVLLAALIAMLCMRLTHFAAIPWLWVFCPLWLPIVLAFLGCLCVFIHLGWWICRHPEEANRLGE